MPTPFESSMICPVLIGRSSQLDLLDQLIARVYAGSGQTVVVAGEAGIGKSRLAAETSARFSAYAATVDATDPRMLQGRCFEPDRVLPYAPLLDLLRTELARHSPADMATLAGWVAADLVRLLPELAEILPNISAPASIDSAQDQRRLTLAIVECLTRLGARQGKQQQSPLLILIEDLHWSDEASLEVLLALARRIPSQPILLVLTYRNNEAPAELAALLLALNRERLGAEVDLIHLTPSDVAAQIRAIFGLPRPVDAAFVRTLYAVTEGNPFFVEETLKALLAAGDIAPSNDTWDAQPFSELRLPRSVQLAVQRRLEQLSPAARDVLRLAAVAGRRFDFSLLQALTGHCEAELVRLLKELIGAQLVVEESADVFAFRHALTRTAVEADLLARERRGLHRQVAEALERISEGAHNRYLADLAEHFYAAEVWASALTYAQAAGEQAQALYSPRAAVEQYTRAIEAARHLGKATPFAVYQARGHAYELFGDFEAARDDYTRALDAARAAADRRAEWQSLLALGFLWSGRDFTETGVYFRQALAVAQEMGDQATIGHSLNRLGNWHMMVEQPLEARQRHEQAQHVFDKLRDRYGLAQTVDLLGTTSMSAGDPLRGSAYYEQAIELFRALKDQQGMASSLTMLALCCDQYLSNTYMAAQTNRTSVSLDYVEEALTIVRMIDWRSGEALAQAVKGQVLSTMGAYGLAFEAMQTGLTIAVEIGHHQWQIYAHLMLGALYADILSTPLAIEYFEQARILAQAVGSLYWFRTVTSFLASCCILQAQTDRAETLLQAVIEPDMPAVTMAQRHAWCAKAELALARNDPAPALTILDRLFASAPNVALGGEHTIPRLALLRGAVLLALGRVAEAEALLRAALATAEQRGIPSMQWRILAQLAVLEQAQGHRDAAQAAGAAAKALAAELAASLADTTLRETFMRGVEAQLRHLPPPSPRRAAKQTYDGLTEREREVAALIAQGLSNRALADTLVLSERTIAKHVENIFSKLGFTTRAQIAVWAVEKGLLSRDRAMD